MKPTKAAFSFDGYIFKTFQFHEHEKESFDGLSITINPSGVYYKRQKKYHLTLRFSASIPNENSSHLDAELISIVMVAHFSLSDGIDEIPEFFYPNCIAIVFPYLRAFISTLTLQANTNQILLPILNLSHLEEPLRINTIVEDSESNA